MTQIMKTEDMNTAIRLLELEKKLSNGELGGGILKVTVNYNEETGKNTMDKTFREIFTAISNGILVIAYNCYFEDVEFNAHAFLALMADTTYDETVSPTYNVYLISLSDIESRTQIDMFQTKDLDGYPVWANTQGVTQGVANDGDIFVARLYFDEQYERIRCNKTWEEINANYDSDTGTFRKPIYAYDAKGNIAICVQGSTLDEQDNRLFEFYFLSFNDASIYNYATAYSYSLNIDNKLRTYPALKIAFTSNEPV